MIKRINVYLKNLINTIKQILLTENEENCLRLCVIDGTSQRPTATYRNGFSHRRKE